MSAFGEKLPKPARWALNILLFVIYWLVGAFIIDQCITFYEGFTNSSMDIILRQAILSIPFVAALIAVIFWPKKVLL